MEYDIQNIENGVKISGIHDFNIESILECGQCFRWNKNNRTDYTGVVFGRVVRIKQLEDSIEILNTSYEEFKAVWHEYFDFGTNYTEIKKQLSNNDSVMKKAVTYAPGIRLLRQPVFETLISFIISANNSIPNIKKIIASLSVLYGEKIVYKGQEYYSFPEAKMLAGANIDEMKKSKAGYRCEYIKKTAEKFVSMSINKQQLRLLDYAKTKELFMQFPGVGAKVADCTILFTGLHFNAFPVDVWVKRIMEKLYLEKEMPLKKIGEYAEKKFGVLAGYGQQYLFYYSRSKL